MKYLILFITILLTACSTSKPGLEKIEQTSVWRLTSFNQNKRELIPQVISESYVIYSKTNNKITVHYILSDKEVDRLQSKWKKRYKKIELQSLTILHELEFSHKNQEFSINNLSVGYILEGKNVERIQKRINDLVYDIEIGESSGLIGLMLEKSHPTPLSQIPTPKLRTKSKYSTVINNGNLILTDKDSKITLTFENNFRIID